MKLFTTTLLAALLSVPSFAAQADVLSLNPTMTCCDEDEDHGDCDGDNGGCSDHILVAGGCGGCDDGEEGDCGEGEGNDSRLIAHGCGDEEGDCDGEGHGEDSILVANEEGEDDDCDGGSCPLPGSIA